MLDRQATVYDSYSTVWNLYLVFGRYSTNSSLLTGGIEHADHREHGCGRTE